VVVLSDGSDTASKLTTPQVATAAQRQGVRIFSVGLESGAFAPGALEALAERSGGTYSLAGSSRSLRRVFDDLGYPPGARAADHLPIGRAGHHHPSTSSCAQRTARPTRRCWATAAAT
jgi:hypothetical protein